MPRGTHPVMPIIGRAAAGGISHLAYLAGPRRSGMAARPKATDQRSRDQASS